MGQGARLLVSRLLLRRVIKEAREQVGAQVAARSGEHVAAAGADHAAREVVDHFGASRDGALGRRELQQAVQAPRRTSRPRGVKASFFNVFYSFWIPGWGKRSARVDTTI